jgi:hypothetical protein
MMIEELAPLVRAGRPQMSRSDKLCSIGYVSFLMLVLIAFTVLGFYRSAYWFGAKSGAPRLVYPVELQIIALMYLLVCFGSAYLAKKCCQWLARVYDGFDM